MKITGVGQFVTWFRYEDNVDARLELKRRDTPYGVMWLGERMFFVGAS